MNLMHTASLVALLTTSGAAYAQSVEAIWSETVAVAMSDTDPKGDWQLLPLDPEPFSSSASGAIQVHLSDGSVRSHAHRWHNITLKRGVIATSDDGSQALMGVEPDEIDVKMVDDEPLWSIDPDTLDYEGGAAVPGVEPDEIDYALAGKLVDAWPGYLVVDVVVARDGSVSYVPAEFIVGLNHL